MGAVLSENVRSFLIGTFPLWAAFGVAVLLWLRRGPVDPTAARELRNPLLLGIAFQCLHMLEEYLTGFATRFPERFGLTPWPDELFLAFNVSWIAIWIASSVGLEKGVRIAALPIWFFALGMVLNLFGHPLLALSAAGYFPGLFTFPFGGILGLVVLKRLLAATSPAGDSPQGA